MGGINMLTLMYFFVQILLVALKIKNVIDWNWCKILIPTYIMFGILVVWFVFCVCMLIASY